MNQLSDLETDLIPIIVWLLSSQPMKLSEVPTRLDIIDVDTTSLLAAIEDLKNQPVNVALPPGGVTT